MTTPSVKIREFIHEIDRENLRYPLSAPNPATCTVKVVIRGEEISIGNICLQWNIVSDIASWTALEEDVLEEARCLYVG